MNGAVFQNTSDWGTYVGKISNGETPVSRGLRLNTQQLMARELIHGLKSLRVNRHVFRDRHGFDVLDLWPREIEALARDGLLDVTDQWIAIARKARPYVDVVCSVFYLPEHDAHKFHRFATEDELAQAAILDVRQAPGNGPVLHRFGVTDEVLVRP
jgi:coproporphyrinogen III oxidase-like Fe-S oxidoreductase